MKQKMLKLITTIKLLYIKHKKYINITKIELNCNESAWIVIVMRPFLVCIIKLETTKLYIFSHGSAKQSNLTKVTSNLLVSFPLHCKTYKKLIIS